MHFKEMIINIEDIKEGDFVLGSDNQWHEAKKLPIQKSITLFEIEFNNGAKIKCSGSHQWSFVNNDDELETYETTFIYNNRRLFQLPIGTKFGPKIKNIKQLPQNEDVVCLTVDSEDHQFYILDSDNKEFNIDDYIFDVLRGKELLHITIDKIKPKDNIVINKKNYCKVFRINKQLNIYEIKINNIFYKLTLDMLFNKLIIAKHGVLTHNCQERLVCGRLGSVASMMALGNTQATAIDGSHKGAGMVNSQGQITNIQYYYADTSWIEDWFKARGLTKKGWEHGEDPNEAINPDDIDFGDDEEIDIIKNKTEIDFEGIHKEIDNSKDQRFTQI